MNNKMSWLFQLTKNHVPQNTQKNRDQNKDARMR